MPFRILPLMTVLAGMLIALSSFAPSVHAGDRLMVQLRDGRSFTARIDARSNQQRLWLRFGTEAVTVLRPIDWSVVAGGSYAGEAVTVEAMRRLVADLESNPFHDYGDQDDGDVAPAAARGKAAVPAAPTDAERARAALGFAPRVAAVALDVYAANWDADVATDGLVVHVSPTDRQGRPVAIRGTLDVELLGLPRRDADAPHHPGQSLRRLGRWTKAVDNRGNASSDLVVQLPFQTLHPEFEAGVGAVGLVNVRLTVPGHGVFTASRDAVQLRLFAPLRDALQRETGRRFLPGEMTGPH